MLCISRTMALLLLGTMAAALPGMQTLAISADSPQSSRPAACHGHHPVTPSKAPVSFQCCVNGHHTALPSALFSPGPFTQASALDDQNSFRQTASESIYLQGSTISASPPIAAPLRV